MLNKMYCVVMWICMEVSLILAMLLGIVLWGLGTIVLFIGGILRKLGFEKLDDKISDSIVGLGEWYSSAAEICISMGEACYEDIGERWNS